MVLRLCVPIEGTDAARLADCLGLDPAKYHAAAAAGASVRDAQEEALLASASALDDDARYKVKQCRVDAFPNFQSLVKAVSRINMCVVSRRSLDRVQHTPNDGV